jgi:hypothetical protein
VYKYCNYVAVRLRPGRFYPQHLGQEELKQLPSPLRLAIATQLAEDDELAAALACRKLREAVAATERRAAGARLSTRIGSVFGSAVKLEWDELVWDALDWGNVEWAVSCGMPLSDKLLNLATQHGELERLRWLRSHGCVWEPCWGNGEDLCSSAAAGGHLAVLQSARAYGCP